MVLGDIGEVAATLKAKGAAGLEAAGFSVFRPVNLMLAQTAQTVRKRFFRVVKRLLNTNMMGQECKFT